MAVSPPESGVVRACPLPIRLRMADGRLAADLSPPIKARQISPVKVDANGHRESVRLHRSTAQA